MADYERPDMSAVGASATVSKQATAASRKELTSFSVRKGDNGGVLICETYEAKPPAGRRGNSASFPSSTDYKENPYGPTDGPAIRARIVSLLGQMTGAVSGGAPEEAMEGEAPAPPPRRPMQGPVGPGPGGPAVRPAAMAALGAGPSGPPAVTGRRPTPLG